jgi:hypothetical protein
MPDIETHNEQIAARQVWLSRAHARYRDNWSELLLSSQGLILQIDVERAFVAGAWVAVIVLAQSVVEATMRDFITQDYDEKAVSLFEGQKRLNRMRKLRNELVHPKSTGAPSLVWRVPGGGFAENHAALEEDAKQAIELMLYVIYSQKIA